MSASTSGSDDGGAEPPGLRRLRRLVTGLTLTLILGVITVVALLVIRLSALSPAQPLLPPALSLPAGESAQAVTFGAGWVAVVTVDAGRRERIRVFDAGGGAEIAALEIGPGAP
ncbi:DUF6476 family protein [Amaricoccus sp.]|uniref:DUF6476 family protein n=1 Tax=Amaricoccus sp. TaxID=1872485 RepID=UPI001B480666|nr:DUF6476 family protein [Amaricoccus sp.]MBP7000487.1 hypothetical protein [Amaricoccus sp.]